MIRIGLPPPVLPRLRLRWQLTRTEVDRRSRNLRDYASLFADRTNVWRRQTFQTLLRPFRLSGLMARRKLAQLERFEACYAELVDLLCWAAKMGMEPEHEAKYARLRIQMRLLYRPMRKALRPYWLDAATPEAADPFETLFLSPELDQVIHNFESIEAMMRAQCSLETYREKLEPPRLSAS